MSVQGNIKPAKSLVELPQVAMDSGPTWSLIPIKNTRNFLEVSAEIVANMDPFFYGDIRAAAFKTLGLT